MAERGRQPDSLFRAVPETLRLRTYTFRFATREQRPKLADSVVNSGRPVNRPVGLGAYRNLELLGKGNAA